MSLYMILSIRKLGSGSDMCDHIPQARHILWYACRRSWYTALYNDVNGHIPKLVDFFLFNIWYNGL